MAHRSVLHIFAFHTSQIAMSFIVAHNFIRRNGKDRLDKIKELSNRKSSRRGKQQKLKEIAALLGVSLQRASILRSQLLEQRWVYSQETLDALELEKVRAKDTIEDVDEMVEKNNVFVLKQKKSA